MNTSDIREKMIVKIIVHHTKYCITWMDKMPLKDTSLLNRTWWKICILGTLLFITLTILVQHERVRKNPNLNHDEKLAFWVWMSIAMASAAFFLNCVFVGFSLLVTGPYHIVIKNEVFGISCVTICVSLIAGISHIISAFSGGFTIDCAGVASPTNQLAEWIVCVPLLFYLVLSATTIKSFSYMDKVILVSIAFAMIGYGIIQLKITYETYILIMVFIYIFSSITAYLMFRRAYIMPNNGTFLQTTTSRGDQIQLSRQRIIGMNLFKLFPFTMPIFPIIYHLAQSKIIDEDVTVFLFTLANLSVKLLYTRLATESYFHSILTDYIEQLQINASRQSFMRYVMHEVRVPLSTISMGIDALSLLEQNEGKDFDDDSKQVNIFHHKRNESEVSDDHKCYNSKLSTNIQTLAMMRDAATFMGDTLNSVLNIQKIEEGKLDLKFHPFFISDLIRKVVQTLHGQIISKKLSILVDIEPNLPRKFIGDAFQIEHVYANFLSNAIKFSDSGSKIDILVTYATDYQLQNSENSTLQRSPGSVAEDILYVRFAVRDYGVGISAGDLCKLFKPFSQIRPGELQGGGGSGVGLSLCKQIVELQGGSVGCHSDEGKGSIFFFILPLVAVTETALVRNVRRISLSMSTRRSRLISLVDGVSVDTVSKRMGEVEDTEMMVSSHSNDEPLRPRDSVRSLPSLVNPLPSSSFSVANEPDDYDGYNSNRSKNAPVTREPFPTTSSSSAAAATIRTSFSRILDRSFKLSDLRPVTSPLTHTCVAMHRLDEVGGGRGVDAISDEIANGSLSRLHRALVVDDVNSNRKLLILLLSRFKIICDEAEDGLVACHQVNQEIDRYDVVFMDNMMPNMNGLAASRALRESGYKNLIIGITGNALDDDVCEFLQSGADLVLLKPMKLEYLHALLTYVKVHGNKSHASVKFKVSGDLIVPIVDTI